MADPGSGVGRLVAVGSSPAAGGGTVAVHEWDGGSPLGAPVAQVAVDSPTWLQWSGDGHRLVVASETERGRVVTLELEGPTSGPALRVVAEVSTGGSHPCHLAATGDGKHLVVANYADGVVSLLAVEDGVPARLVDTVRLEGSGPVTDRQERSHPHHVAPVGSSAVSVVDLGSDRIWTFEVAGERLGTMATTDLPPGTGPRHLVRSGASPAAFLACELSGQVLRLTEGARGEFTVAAAARASARPAPNDVAHVALDDALGRLYVSNRGPDTVTTFDVSGEGLVLVDEVDVPAHPRHFTVAAGRVLVGGLHGNAVSVHRRSADGRLGPGVTTRVDSPACVVVRP